MIQDGRFLYVNPAFAKLFGSTVDEILAVADYTDLFVPEDREEIRRVVAERLAGIKKSERYTRRAVKRDGTIVPVVIHGSRTRYQGKDAIIGTVTGP
jgi:PAS domain S-box-containing protein